MINAILVFNNHGKPRLSKFYQYYVSNRKEIRKRKKINYCILRALTDKNNCVLQTTEEQQQFITEIYQLVSKRDDQTCNFLELSDSVLSKRSTETFKVIYRHYATLYFVFVVDAAESELGILDLIQVFVEALDRSFANVCELDLIFNSDQVLLLVNEIVQSGMVLETNINNIIAKFEEQNKIAKVETSPASAKATSAISTLKNLPQLREKVMDLPNTFKDLKF